MQNFEDYIQIPNQNLNLEFYFLADVFTKALIHHSGRNLVPIYSDVESLLNVYLFVTFKNIL